jgi:pimeloyl-ACP methyl ester carboxylesterase
VRGIALVAPHVMVEPFSLVEIARARKRWDSTDLRARMLKYHRDPDAAFLGWNDAWLDPRFPSALELQPEIAHVRVPILVVQGEADPYGTLEHLRIIERESYCPVDSLVLPGIGHAPHLEAPGPTLAAVADFAGRIFHIHEAATAGQEK